MGFLVLNLQKKMGREVFRVGDGFVDGEISTVRYKKYSNGYTASIAKWYHFAAS